MATDPTPFVIPLLIASTVSLGLFVLTAMHREEQGAYPMMGFLASIVIWTGAYAIQMTTNGQGASIFWNNVRYFGISIAPVATLVFTLEYTGRGDLVTRRNALALLAIPAITSLLMWTNGVHHLWAASYTYQDSGLVRLTWTGGPWYDVHIIYSFATSLAAIALFGRRWVVEEGAAPFTKTTVLLVAVVLPTLGSLVSVLGWAPLDMAPFALTVSGVAIVSAIFYF